MLENLKLRWELHHYNAYAKMNKKRKEKDKINPVSRKIDDLRRRSGFVR